MDDTSTLRVHPFSALTLFGSALLAASAGAQATYYPPPASAGGWRSLVTPGVEPSPAQKEAIRQTVAMEWDELETAWELAEPWGTGGFLVVRQGWIVGEWGDGVPLSIGSCTKSLTSLAMQRIFEMSEAGLLAQPVSEDDPAWLHLPAVWSNGQPEKQAIELRHLLTMSSGLEPDDAPVPTASYLDRVLSLSVEDPPGETWAYASAPVDLLSLVVEDVTGKTLADFFRDEIAGPVGMGDVTWSFMGPHTVASAYCETTPRDLARVGYLLLHEGRWDDGSGPRQIVSSGRVAGAVGPHFPLLASAFALPNNFTNDPHSNLRYGKLFWATNLQTSLVPGQAPADAYYMAGFGTNYCYVVPQYDLVVVRTGTHPRPWDDDLFVGMMDHVIGAVLDRVPHASVALTGMPCGPSSEPLLFSTPPVLGESVTVGFPKLVPGERAVLFVGLPAPSPVPYGNGCAVGISTPFLGTVLLAPGTASSSVTVPSLPALSGLDLAYQGLVLHASGQGSLTNAVRLEIGH